MLAGFAGHLLSESFLEEKLVGADIRDVGAGWRSFGDARRRSQSLGPASSLRAMLGTGAAPLAASLGFGEPRDLEFDRSALIATLDTGAEPVVLIVTQWCEPFDPLWREAVAQAVRRSSRWCALYN